MEADAAADLIRALMPELHRVLKPGGHIYIFFAYELYPSLRTAMEEHFALQWYPIVWNKMRTMSANTGYNYAPCYEPIMFGWKEPRTRRLRKNHRAIMDHKVVNSKDKLHPFEKPQELLRELIESSTSQGDVVLDPFAGSGSTLVAAASLHRNGIGFEFDRSNFVTAQARLMGEIEG